MRLWRVYCGRVRRTGEPVTDGEFGNFLRDTVSRSLTAFTVVAASGYWRAEPEASSVIEWIDPTGEGEGDVEQIATSYKRRFDQDAVLVTGADLEASLV